MRVKIGDYPLRVGLGNTKGGSITVPLTSCLTGLESAVWQLTFFCFYLQNRLIQYSQTGGQLYSDTSPFSIPWLGRLLWLVLTNTLTFKYCRKSLLYYAHCFIPFYVRNLRMFVISWSVCHWQIFPTFMGKPRRQWSTWKVIHSGRLWPYSQALE